MWKQKKQEWKIQISNHYLIIYLKKKKDEPKSNNTLNTLTSSNGTSSSQLKSSKNDNSVYTVNSGKVPDFTKSFSLPFENTIKKEPKLSPKETLGVGTPMPVADTKTTKNITQSNPYAVDITDKSRDNTTTNTDKQAKIQSEIDDNTLDERNTNTYLGASVKLSKQAQEVNHSGDELGNLIYYTDNILDANSDIYDRLTDEDKALFDINKELKKLYDNLDILKSNNDNNGAKIIQKQISDSEAIKAGYETERNSQVDDNLKGLYKTLDSGVDYIDVPQYNIKGEWVGNIQHQIPLSEDKKKDIIEQIDYLKKQKGDFFTKKGSIQNVMAEVEPQLKMYVDKNIIPKDASDIDKLKIHYGIRLNQLRSLEKSEQAKLDNSLLLKNNPIIDKFDLTRNTANSIKKSLLKRVPFVDTSNGDEILKIKKELRKLKLISITNQKKQLII